MTGRLFKGGDRNLMLVRTPVQQRCDAVNSRTPQETKHGRMFEMLGRLASGLRIFGFRYAHVAVNLMQFTRMESSITKLQSFDFMVQNFYKIEVVNITFKTCQFDWTSVSESSFLISMSCACCLMLAVGTSPKRTPQNRDRTFMILNIAELARN